ncbi:MAG: MGMT family protein [Patescibacteria group bacterium]
MNTSFFQRVFTLVKQIPVGYVTTYGAIAKAIGTKDARRVGHALHANADPATIPCHRVVFSDGRLASGYVFGGPDEQKKRLELEGVGFTVTNTVDLAKFSYPLK